MTLKIIKLLFLVLLFTSCIAQEKEYIIYGTENNKKVVWGTPKEVTYFTYKPKVLADGTVEKGDFLMTHGHLIGFGHQDHFDREGRWTKSFLYGEGDSTMTKGGFWTYKLGNMVRFESKNGSPPYPETGYRAAYDFEVDSSDVQGNKLWRKEYWQFYDEEKDEYRSTINNIFIYIYDDNGSLIKEIKEKYDLVSNDGPDYKTMLEKKTVTTYDVEYRDGRLYRYGRSPEYTETWFKSFTGVEPGKEQRRKTKWPQFSLYFYDAEGNKVREEIEGMPNYWEFYPNGIIKKSFYGEENYSINNEDGYVVKLVVDRPRPTNAYEAKYDQLDEHGNWTRVIVYKNGVPNEYGERKIIYYDK